MRERRALPERMGGRRPAYRLREGKGAIMCVLLLASFLSLPAGAQAPSRLTSKGFRSLIGWSAQSGSYDAENSLGNAAPADAMHREIKEKQIRELRKQRYAQVVANTEEILRLATELNAEVSASPGVRLTAGQLRTLARIEKLARSVKEGMVSPVPVETPPASTPVVGFP